MTRSAIKPIGRWALCALPLAGIWGGSLPAQPQPAAAFPPEVAAHVPRNLRSYFVALLINQPEPRAMSQEIFVRHMDYVRSQFEAGVYRVAGPFEDGGRIRGIFILSAGSIEQARAIVAADPAVQANLFTVEIHPATFPDLSALRVEYPPRP